MPGELLSNALFKRRGDDTNGGDVWESAPAESNADAHAHLAKLSFDAPSSEAWLRSLDDTLLEEDGLEEALSEQVAARGEGPEHVPKAISDEDRARVRELAESLAKMKEEFLAERETIGEAREELSRRETELKAREAAVEAARTELEQRQKAREDYPQPSWLENVNGALNIGITGNAGVGKSLLINKIRRVRPGSEAWAPVGVNETTMRPTMYKFPSEPRVRLWDLPGAGTANFPSDTYIQDMGLRYFDTIIIVTAGRYTSTEIRLKEELQKHKVTFFMIRTKVDIDSWNNKLDNNLESEETIEQIREDLRSSHGINHCYLVSSRDPEAYDMPRLMKDLFPGLKRELDPNAPDFIPGWSTDGWAMPTAYSNVLSGIQGRWQDAYGTRYLIHGYQAHVTLREGQSAALTLRDSPSEDQVWWCDRWWINSASVAGARKTGQLRWSPANLADKPLIWWWVDGA